MEHFDKFGFDVISIPFLNVSTISDGMHGERVPPTGRECARITFRTKSKAFKKRFQNLIFYARAVLQIDFEETAKKQFVNLKLPIRQIARLSRK